MSLARGAGVGTASGLALGVALGLGLTLGLGIYTSVGLLSILLSMGAGATAGAFLGKAPWKHSSSLESVLRIVGGLALGPILLAILGRFLSFSVPFALLGAPRDTLAHELPLLYVPIITTLYGLLLGLEGGVDPRATAKPSP